MIGNWHYVIPEYKRAPDGLLARGPDVWISGSVTSLGRARARLRARTTSRARYTYIE